MDKNYLRDCLAIEGTINLVFDDNASFTFLAEKATKSDGGIVEFAQSPQLFFSAAPVIDNEPVFVGDKIRLEKREGGFLFPENLTRNMYAPLLDILTELNKNNCLLTNKRVVIIASVDKIFVGFADNIWLRVRVASVSTDTMRQDGVNKSIVLYFGDCNGLFDSMSDTVKNSAKIVLKKAKVGEKIYIELSDFSVVNTELRCNNIRFGKIIGAMMQPLPDAELPLIDISELWS